MLSDYEIMIVEGMETEHTETAEEIHERTCFSQYVKKSNDENRQRKIKDIKIW